MKFVVGQRVRVKIENMMVKGNRYFIDESPNEVPNPCFGHIKHIDLDEIHVDIFKPLTGTTGFEIHTYFAEKYLEAVD